MHSRLVKLVSIVLFTVLAVSAQEPSSAAQDAAARRLVEVMGIKKMFDTVVPQLMAQIDQQTDRTIQDLLKKENIPNEGLETRGKIREFASRWFTQEFRLYDIESSAARIYARHFTAEELQALIQFYESPAGKKMLEKTPVIAQESMMDTMTFTQQMMGRFLEAIKEKFPEIFTPLPRQP